MLVTYRGFHSGAAKFNDLIAAKWRKAEEEQFGYDLALLKWAREGGELPAP